MSNPNIEPVEVALLQRNASLPEPQRVLSRFVEFYKASLQREQEMLIKQETASDLLASEDALDDVADLASLAAAAEEGGLVPSEGEGVGPAAFEALEGLGGAELGDDAGDSGVGDDPGAFFADLGGEPLDPPVEPDFGASAADESPDDFFAEIAAEPNEGPGDPLAEAASGESGASDESFESGFDVAGSGELGDLVGEGAGEPLGDTGGETAQDGAVAESFYDQPTPVPSEVGAEPEDGAGIAAVADDGITAEASPLELAAAAEEGLSPLELAAAAEEAAAVEEVPVEEPPKKKSKKKSKKKKK